MNNSVSTVVKKNLSFVKEKTHINLDFVYLQMDNITKLLGNERFMNELKDLVDIVLDKDNNGVFDHNDIKLLRDIFMKKNNQVLNIYNFIMEIFNSVLALILKVDKPIVKFNKDAVEGLFFGVFSYVLFQYGTMHEEDKELVLDILVAVYTTLETVDNTLNITKKLRRLAKKRGWCNCLFETGSTDVAPELEKEILRSSDRVKEFTMNVKETENFHQRVENIEKYVNGSMGNKQEHTIEKNIP